MSFYGNIFYGAADAFASLFVKNNGKYVDNFIIAADNGIEIPAIGLGGHFNLDSGNKWINLVGDIYSNSCYIYHAKPQEADGFNIAPSFVLGQQGAEEIQSLSPGETFSTSNVYYDNAGHITKVEPMTFKLPISDTEQELADLQATIAEIQEVDLNQDAIISGLQTNVTALQTDQSNTTLQLSNLKDIVGDKSGYGLSPDTRPITSIIGSTYNLKNAFVDNGITLSGAILNVRDEAKVVDDRVTGLASLVGSKDLATKTAISNLCKALEAYNITIDANSLWENV